MTIINELIQVREKLLSSSKGQAEFLDDQMVLPEVLQLMFDAKLVDSEDLNEAYFISGENDTKINGYAINESGERLQIFIVSENFIREDLNEQEILVSEKSVYEKQLKRAVRFIRESLNGTQVEKIQHSDPARALSVYLSTSEGISSIDTIEVFLITFSASVSRRGSELQPRDVNFPDSVIKGKVNLGTELRNKEILLLQRVIDINFLHSVLESQGNRQPLEIDFQRDFNERLEVLQAAEEKTFESYLGVVSADLLHNLYRKYSSRLLEKMSDLFCNLKGRMQE